LDSTQGRAVLTARRGQSAAARDPEWLTCLREFCALLWPQPASIALETTGEPRWPHRRRLARRALEAGYLPEGEFALVPWFRRAPLLVPRGRRVAAAAVRHYSGATSSASRLIVNSLSLLLAGGMTPALLCGRLRVKARPGADTIEGYLAEVMLRDIRISMYLGPARANRKPVLQLLTGSGETIGFAKIGVSPLTSKLVRAERQALAKLAEAGLQEITVPRVLHYDVWHGLDVLVLSPLPAWRRRRPVSESRLASSMIELSRASGLRHESLAGSGYLQRLRANLASADDSAEQAALMQALDSLAVWAGGTTLSFGSWHGDWSPWNMANISRGLLVWDWERFTTGVPQGFDALHYWLQTELKMRHCDPPDAAARCIQQAPRLLSPFHVDATTARITAILYLADLATRYLVDRQAEAGSPLGAPGTWLLPVIRSEVAAALA
jgi:hypothetical protein